MNTDTSTFIQDELDQFPPASSEEIPSSALLPNLPLSDSQLSDSTPPPYSFSPPKPTLSWWDRFRLKHGWLDPNSFKPSPYLAGTILRVMADQRALIELQTGERLFAVLPQSSDINRTFPPDSPKWIGMQVGVEMDTYQISQIYPPTSEDHRIQPFLRTPPPIGYADIIGLESQVQLVREAIELPMHSPQRFAQMGITPPKGILLYGPPGTGKTMIAQAVATETQATFLSIVGSELVNKYIGDGAKTVAQVFEYARAHPPSIIFIDEIDSVAGKREGSQNRSEAEVNRTLMQLLAELDGFSPLGSTKIIAATNRRDILDPALLRPGRLDRIIPIPLPSSPARNHLFTYYTRHMPLAADVQWAPFVDHALSGAQIHLVCQEAGMNAIRHHRSKATQADFKKGLDRVLVYAKTAAEIKKRQQLARTFLRSCADLPS